MRPECQEVPHAAKIRRQALAILSSEANTDVVGTSTRHLPQFWRFHFLPENRPMKPGNPVNSTKYLTKGLVVSAAPSLALQNSTATNAVPEPLQNCRGDSPAFSKPPSLISHRFGASCRKVTVCQMVYQQFQLPTLHDWIGIAAGLEKKKTVRWLVNSATQAISHRIWLILAKRWHGPPVKWSSSRHAD